MLHGWTEYDAVSLERQMFNSRLDITGTQPEISNATTTRVRAAVATVLVALAARLAPAAGIEQRRYSTTAHA